MSLHRSVLSYTSLKQIFFSRKNQSGEKAIPAGHSCCSALLKLTDNWRQALKNKKDMAAVAVDLSKAFHAICHNLLLLKMKAYGVRDYASKLIQSYLSVRFKRVTCNGKVSDWLPLRCEVPQGSLLGPLFFNAFVNYIN